MSILILLSVAKAMIRLDKWTSLSGSIIKVVYADQFKRSSFNDMVHKIWEIRNMVGDLSNVYIDMANVEFIEAIKQELGENPNWQYIHEKIAWAKKNRLAI